MSLLFIPSTEQTKLLNNDSNICFNVAALHGTILILVHVGKSKFACRTRLGTSVNFLISQLLLIIFINMMQFAVSTFMRKAVYHYNI